MTAAVENTFLMETGHPVYIGVSEPRAELDRISEAFDEAREAINIRPRLPQHGQRLFLQTACFWSAF